MLLGMDLKATEPFKRHPTVCLGRHLSGGPFFMALMPIKTLNPKPWYIPKTLL